MTIVRHLRRALRNRTVRFFITGGGAAALSYLVTFALLRGGLPPAAASILAFLCAFATSYMAQRAWTFDGSHSHSEAFPRYAGAQAISMAATALVAQAAGAVGLPPSRLSLVTTLFGSAVSYCLSRYWVFAPRRTANATAVPSTGP